MYHVLVNTFHRLRHCVPGVYTLLLVLGGEAVAASAAHPVHLTRVAQRPEQKSPHVDVMWYTIENMRSVVEVSDAVESGYTCVCATRYGYCGDFTPLGPLAGERNVGYEC